MLADDDAHASTDRRAIAFGPDQLHLDPVLPVASFVAQKRRQIIEVENERIDTAIVEVVAKGRATAGEALAYTGTHLRGDILEFAIAQVAIDDARVLVGFPEAIVIDLGINMAVDLEDVRPAVVVEVEEAAAPGDIATVDADT